MNNSRARARRLIAALLLAAAAIPASARFLPAVFAAPAEQSQIPPAIAKAMEQAGPEDPVSGKKVKSKNPPIAIFLDKVYKFEKAANLAKFRAAPEQYATTTCPVSDKVVRIKDATQKTQYGGRTWYFCCGDCKGQFEASPADYVTYRCPSCGGIALAGMEGSVTATYDGREMRFCCTHCQEAFEVNPAEYFALVVPEEGDKSPGAAPAKK